MTDIGVQTHSSRWFKAAITCAAISIFFAFASRPRAGPENEDESDEERSEQAQTPSQLLDNSGSLVVSNPSRELYDNNQSIVLQEENASLPAVSPEFSQQEQIEVELMLRLSMSYGSLDSLRVITNEEESLANMLHSINIALYSSSCRMIGTQWLLRYVSVCSTSMIILK